MGDFASICIIFEGILKRIIFSKLVCSPSLGLHLIILAASNTELFSWVQLRFEILYLFKTLTMPIFRNGRKLVIKNLERSKRMEFLLDDK